MSHTKNDWKIIAKALDKIQAQALEAKSTEALFELLLETELPVPRKNISIVYQDYGAVKPEFWATADIIRKRIIIEETGIHRIDFEPKTDFPANHRRILEVIKTGQYCYLENQAECETEGFKYKSVLIVPMRLNEYKNTGAFIIHSLEDENAYDEDRIESLDTLSNRFAYYIRHNLRKRRNAAFQAVGDELHGTSFQRECQIIDTLGAFQFYTPPTAVMK